MIRSQNIVSNGIKNKKFKTQVTQIFFFWKKKWFYSPLIPRLLSRWLGRRLRRLSNCILRSCFGVCHLVRFRISIGSVFDHRALRTSHLSRSLILPLRPVTRPLPLRQPPFRIWWWTRVRRVKPFRIPWLSLFFFTVSVLFASNGLVIPTWGLLSTCFAPEVFSKLPISTAFEPGSGFSCFS